MYPKDATAKDLAQYAAEEFYSERYALVDEKIPLRDGKEMMFTIGHIVNGAMLAGIAECAATIAERRDRESGALTGVTREDLLASVVENFKEKGGLTTRMN